jgi:spore maturation protein B
MGMGTIIEQMGATIVGASETIFYTMAIYFGSLKIKNTRHTLACAMLSHIAGVLASVFICYILFT